MNEDTQLHVAVRRAKQGDAQAFEELYNLTYKYAYFHARSILKDENEAWDLVQETYIAVYQNIGTLKEDNYIKSWIGGIVFNLGHKKLRKKADILVGGEEEFLFENIEGKDKDLSPEEALDSKETASMIEEVIDRLPLLQKAAVIAYYFDEKNIAAIADEAMCSVGTIKSRLNYARKAMKDSIEEKERKMGVTLHTVTGPIIIQVLREMFMQLKVSETKAQSILVAVKNSLGLLGAGASGIATGAASGGASGAASGGVSGGAKVISSLFGTIKIKALIVAATVVIIGGGVGVASFIANGKKVDAPIETTTRIETEPVTTEVETTEVETTELTEAEPGPGWVEVETGWKYMEEDKTYVSHTWKVVARELYYFNKNEIMAVGDVYLGRQKFTFNDSGRLIRISPADGDTNNTSFYDEDIKYYVEGNNIHAVGEDGADKIIYSLPQKIFNLSVDGDMIYFMCENRLCSIKVDGTEFKEIVSDRSWWTAISIDAQAGDVAFNYTDETEGDADLVKGAIYAVENGVVNGKKEIDGYPREYEKLQVSGDWVYCLHSFSENFTWMYDGGPYNNVVLRVSDNTVEKITEEGVEEYFVYEDIIYYMQSGQLKQLSISEATAGQRAKKEATYNNPIEAYQNYVDEVLVNKFGKFNSFHVEYGYKQYDSGLKTTSPNLDNGIISTHIEDMNSDGVPELMVFTASDSQYEGKDINLNTYHIDDGKIKFSGEMKLLTGLFKVNSHELQIFIKDFGDRKVIGASSKGYAYVIGDGTAFEVNLYQINKSGDVETLLSKAEAGSDWFENKAPWVDDIRKQGFHVTADEWVQDDNDNLYISSKEPGYKALVTGGASSNLEETSLTSGTYNLTAEEITEMLAPYKVVGDIVVHN